MPSIERACTLIEQLPGLKSSVKREGVMNALRDDLSALRKQQIENIGKKYIWRIFYWACERKIYHTTFIELCSMLRVHNIRSVYDKLETYVLNLVSENKYQGDRFILSLLNIRHQLDQDTSSLQDTFIARYLTPNQFGVIDSRFLFAFATKYPNYDRKKLMRHCFKFRQYTDSYGLSILKVLIKLCPEYEKYVVLE